MTAREKWVRAIDVGLLVDAIFVDFGKAFDRVDHNNLVRFLITNRFSSPLVAWIADFLRDRRSTVRVNGLLSNVHDVTSGVPQGTVLGPVLFNIYINQIPDCLHSDCLLFADDLKI